MKSDAIDHILFFVAGALGPIIVLTNTSTTWVDMTQPLIILAIMYNGCLNVIALRKQLYSKAYGNLLPIQQPKTKIDTP